MQSCNSNRVEHINHLKQEWNSPKMKKVLASILLFYLFSMSIE